VKIRTLRASEREALLELLDGWEVPDGWPGRSADFFRRYVEDDPTFRDENVIVAEDAGRLVSCAQIFPRPLRVGDATVPAGGIGSVFTRPEARRSGVASAVLEEAARSMRERGMLLSLLFASRLSFYGRLGWESWRGARTLVRRTDSAVPAAATNGIRIEPFARERDLEDVRSLHTSYTGKRQGAVIRDEALWEATLRNGGNPAEDFFVARRGSEVVAYARATVVSGFLILTELGRTQDDASALADLVVRLLTPREHDPLERPGRPSCELRSLGVGPLLDDAALADELAARGLGLSTHPDENTMLRCLDPEGLARATGAKLPAGDGGHSLLRRLLPPERFAFWSADRF
jgi:predicted N-acetyltransferase YhbS